MHLRTFLLALLLPASATLSAALPDTTSVADGLSLAALATAGNVLKADEYERMWLKDNAAWTVGAELRYDTRFSPDDPFARDFGYPTLALGLRYSRFGNVTMRKTAAPDWGMSQMADYTSRMGDIFTLYGSFRRPWLRTRGQRTGRTRWTFDYTLDVGVGYGLRPYNPTDNVDNELIGSRWLIYFAAGVHATWHATPRVGVQLGLDFSHHSNGALNRPNKGVNLLGPTVGLDVRTGASGVPQPDTARTEPFRPRIYADIAIGFGGKALLEDWLQTQFNTPPGDPDYHRGHFNVYPCYSLQADVMCRYARRWASGIGLDLFYADAAHRIARIDRAKGLDRKHSPWSVGIAAKHETFFHNLSLNVALGFYLYRHMGETASWEEKPYYERVGLKYTFPKLHGLFVGGNVKAHLTKADFTELVVGMNL